MPVLGSSGDEVKKFVIPSHNGFLGEPDDFKLVNVCIQTFHHLRYRLLNKGYAAFQTVKERPK
jgi:hypothetical protein